MSTGSRVLITGGAGFLGQALLRSAPAGVSIDVTVRRTRPAVPARAHCVDLSDRAEVDRLWQQVRPDLVVHTAYSVNAPERDIWLATRNVADATRAAGSTLLYMSTDMLLDGEHAPYGEDASPHPVLEYGRWKARAEEYVRSSLPSADVVRTSLLTSFEPLDPRSQWVARGLSGEAGTSLYADEIRCPIAVGDVAAQIWEIAELDAGARGGVWHLAGPEAISRYSLGLLIAAFLGRSATPLIAAPSSASESPRPRDLRLLTGRADRQLRTRARPISRVAMEEKQAREQSRTTAPEP